MFGAEKYSANNWKKGLKYTEILESMQRHINSFLEREDNDQESKLSHIGHILCNAMFLSYMFLFRKDLDDRFIDKNIINEKKFEYDHLDVMEWVNDIPTPQVFTDDLKEQIINKINEIDE